MTDERVCPWWMGWALASPLRRIFRNPAALVSPYIREGMTVLEPGPGMGFFTLELARLVGPAGRVVAVDVQPKMVEGLMRRAAKAGLSDRVDARMAAPRTLGIADLEDAVDFALAYAVVHELPTGHPFFAEVGRSLKRGASLLLAEPATHVKPGKFEEELAAAAAAGLKVSAQPSIRSYRSVLLTKT